LGDVPYWKTLELPRGKSAKVQKGGGGEGIRHQGKGGLEYLFLNPAPGKRRRSGGDRSHGGQKRDLGEKGYS